MQWLFSWVFRATYSFSIGCTSWARNVLICTGVLRGNCPFSELFNQWLSWHFSLITMTRPIYMSRSEGWLFWVEFLYLLVLFIIIREYSSNGQGLCLFVMAVADIGSLCSIFIHYVISITSETIVLAYFLPPAALNIICKASDLTKCLVNKLAFTLDSF